VRKRKKRRFGVNRIKTAVKGGNVINTFSDISSFNKEGSEGVVGYLKTKSTDFVTQWFTLK